MVLSKEVWDMYGGFEITISHSDWRHGAAVSVVENISSRVNEMW